MDLNAIKERIFAFYKAYDELQEPKRFWAFFIPAAIIIVGVCAGNAFVSAVSWIILLIALVTRVLYIYR